VDQSVDLTIGLSLMTLTELDWILRKAPPLFWNVTLN